MKPLAFAAALIFATAAATLHAHGTAMESKQPFDPSNVEQTAFGHAGDPKSAKRIVTITMKDTMRFAPATLTIKQGETVRFVVRNDGIQMHEMVLGTDADLAKHADLMRKFPQMEHAQPHMVHVMAGDHEDMVWTFNRPGEFRFACLIPGHYEAGMVGKIIVK
jgi:uncharacterized cupredoxin-like copper-binding protein